jgi:hypothetical protein
MHIYTSRHARFTPQYGWAIIVEWERYAIIADDASQTRPR